MPYCSEQDGHIPILAISGVLTFTGGAAVCGAPTNRAARQDTSPNAVLRDEAWPVASRRRRHTNWVKGEPVHRSERFDLCSMIPHVHKVCVKAQKFGALFVCFNYRKLRSLSVCLFTILERGLENDSAVTSCCTVTFRPPLRLALQGKRSACTSSMCWIL